MIEQQNEKPKQANKILLILLLLVFVGSVGFLFGYATPRRVSPSVLPSIISNTILSEPDGSSIDENVFENVWNRVDNDFLYRTDLTADDLYYGTLKGLIASLGDPYSVFLTPDETKAFTEGLTGSFEGIGAEIAMRDEQLTIVAPLPGSPAEEAGLLPNDVITQIDGESSVLYDLDEAVSRIKGEAGSVVVLTITREGKSEPFDVSVTRNTIQITSVSYEMNDTVAVLTVSGFNEDTQRELSNVLQDIALESPEGIIIDLRNNPGGLLDVSVEVANTFLEKGTTVVIERDAQGAEIVHNTDRTGKYTEIPLVVLVNEGSASASEIVAGALKDLGRAKLIGMKTFGKGTVQSFETLSDGSSLKITVAEWLTPDGISFHEKGIEPDIVVEMTEEDYTEGRDPQLDRALEEIRLLF